MSNSSLNRHTLLFILACATATTAAAQIRMFSLRPATEHGCVAVRLDLAQADVLSGIRWLHNDATVSFPKLLLLEAEPGQLPDLNDTGLILLELSGEELSYGEAAFELPVVSSTGSIYAVFVYPDGANTTGIGNGQGPAIGLTAAGQGLEFLISADGLQWVPFAKEHRLDIQPIIASAAKAGGAVLLSSLAASVDYLGSRAQAEEAPRILQNALLPPYPNPFNPRVTIQYELAAVAQVALRLYDLRGRLVTTLVEGTRPMGRHRVIWEGQDARGRSVASGVYLLKAQIAGQTFHSRLTLVR